MEGFEQFHNIQRIGAVEAGGRLVGNQQAGLVNHCARDAQTLLFAAGQSDGHIVFAAFQADFLNRNTRALFRFARLIAANPQRQDNVLQDIAVVEDFVVLEDNADMLAHKADLIVAQGAEVLVVEPNLAFGRLGNA